MPKISVIVPVYNVEPYLRRCVDSILAQTFTDFELILVDDGSPDGCGAICDEYIDPQITVIHRPNGGLSAARNSGIDWAFACSDSEWLSFIDSDDWVHPQYLKALYQAIKEWKTEISSCGVLRMDQYNLPDNTEYSSSLELAEDVYTNFGKKAVSYAFGRLYRKQLFEQIRYPDGRLFEDVATTYKVLLSVDRIAYIPQELYYYFQNQAGIVRQNWNPKKLDEFIGYEEQLEYLKKHDEFQKTYRVIQHDYSQELSYQYFATRGSKLNSLEKKCYLKVISKKARKAVLSFYRTANVKPRRNQDIFETAFPKLMNGYWILKSIVIKKLGVGQR